MSQSTTYIMATHKYTKQPMRYTITVVPGSQFDSVVSEVKQCKKRPPNTHKAQFLESASSSAPQPRVTTWKTNSTKSSKTTDKSVFN